MGPTTVTDPLGNVQIHAFTNLGVSFGSNMLVENQVEYRDSSGTPLRRVNTDWATDTGPAISFQTVDTNDSPVQNTGYYLGDNQSRNPRVIRVTTTLLDTNQVSKIETDYADCMSWSGYYSTTYTDCPSNPTQIREYDYGTGSAGSLLRYTNLTYLHGTSGSYFNAHMLDRVATKSIYTGGGALFAQTTYGYDTTMITGTSSVPYHDYTNYSSGNTVRGNVTTVTNLLNPGNTSLTTYNYYNDVGNLVKIIDPGTHATQFSYADNFTDAANRNSQGYVTSVAYPTTSNGVPHADGKQYFWYTGAVAAVCGENAPSPSACVNTYIPSPPTTIYADYTKYTYDMLGRPLTVINGDGGTSSVTFSDLTSTSTPITVGSSSAIDSSHNLVNTAVLDGFGRTAHTQLNSDPCGTDLTDTTYDAVDRKSTVSNPYRTSDSCSAGTSTNGTSTYQYDALGRLVKVIPPDGSSSANNVTTTYSGNCTTVTDQAGKARKSCSDGLGRLIKAFESPSSLNYETDYVYDVLNNLTQVVQKGGTSDTSQWRTRTFAYDSLSRLTSASNPESGTVSYTYDSDGNML